MIRQRAGGGNSRRPIIRKSDADLWEKVTLQTGIDYWHFFKVICSLVIVVCIYNFIYKGRTLKQVIQLLPSRVSAQTVTTNPALAPVISQITQRILCIVGLDSSDSDDSIDIAERYLAKSCGGLLFITDQDKHKAHKFKNVKTEFVHVENKNLKFWEQRRYITYQAIAYAFKKRPNFEWYLRIAKPNVLTFTENFARMIKLKGYASNAKHYLGHTLTKEGKPFNYALSAYALSRGSIMALGPSMVAITNGDESSFRCKDQEFHTEDDFAFFCLEDEFQIKPGDTRDSNGREYFLIFQVKDHYREMNVYRDDWFWQNKEKKNLGENCCADYPVAFTNYKPTALSQLYGMVYDQPGLLENMQIKRLASMRT